MATTPKIPRDATARCPQCEELSTDKHCTDEKYVGCPWWLCFGCKVTFTAKGGSMPIKAPA